MFRVIRAAGLALLLTAIAGCTAHRGSAAADHNQTAPADSPAYPASQQPAQSLSERLQVQDEARQAASVLKQLIGVVLQMPKANPATVSALTRDVAQLSTGLDTIAQSRTEQEFTTAVFDMCEPDSLAASNRVGPLLIGLAARIRVNPPPQTPVDRTVGWAQYFDSLGETLMRIPRQCRHAQQAMAAARAQAQEQAAAAQLQSQRRRQAMAMLMCISSGMLAPVSGRNQPGTVTRFSGAVQNCQP